MEEKKQVLEIAIPEGKVAKWNDNGMLQLFDKADDVLDPTVPITERVLQLFDKADDVLDPTVPITERVKTFEDAVKIVEAKGDPDGLLKEWNTINFHDVKDDLKAFLMLGIIVAALNDGWKPGFDTDERHWTPYLILYTKDEIEDMDDYDKDDICLQLWRAGGYSNCGSRCGLGCSDSYSAISARLALKSRDLALYCGRQFIRLWSQYYCGCDCKPWREIDFTDDNDNED